MYKLYFVFNDARAHTNAHVRTLARNTKCAKNGNVKENGAEFVNQRLGPIFYYYLVF